MLEARVDRKLETSVTSLQTFARSVAARYYVIAKRKRTTMVCIHVPQQVPLFLSKRGSHAVPAARAHAVVMALRAFKKYAVDDNEMHQYSIPYNELSHGSTLCYWAFVGLESENSRSRSIRKATHTRVAWAKPEASA